MSDLLMIGLSLVFFAASFGLLALCERLMEG
jgi:hypothetical protein